MFVGGAGWRFLGLGLGGRKDRYGEGCLRGRMEIFWGWGGRKENLTFDNYSNILITPYETRIL